MSARLTQQQQSVKEESVSFRLPLARSDLIDETFADKFVTSWTRFLPFPAIDTTLQFLELAQGGLSTATRTSQQSRPD